MNPAFLEMLFGLPIPMQKSWIAAVEKGIWSKTRAEQERLLRAQLEGFDLEPHREKIVNGLMREIRFEDVVPSIYAEYKPIVCDGIRFFLERFAIDRLKTLCLNQLLLPDSTPQGERLIHLVAEIPTLFKLGQIIARNPGLDPDLKAWLTRLEDGADEPQADLVHRQILDQFNTPTHQTIATIDDIPYAAASVGVVQSVTLHRPDHTTFAAVAKRLRPHVPTHLVEELLALEALGDFFEEHRHRYALKKFAFRETFDDIRTALKRETDLTVEQRHLTAAALFYSGSAAICIPELQPESTPAMTVMQKLPGRKLTATGAAMTSPERRRSARTLYRELILRPLFSDAPQAIFHGDPHAGNLLAVPSTRPSSHDSPSAMLQKTAQPGHSAPSGRPSITGQPRMPAAGAGDSATSANRNPASWQIGLLDWSQTGTLDQASRQHILQIALGIWIEDTWRIRGALQALALPSTLLEQIVGDTISALFLPRKTSTGPDPHHVGSGRLPPWTASPDVSLANCKCPVPATLLEKTFWLVDELMVQGVKFPADLLLFRKALFTLTGVLHDLDPAFDMEDATTAYLEKLLLAEMPQRSLWSLFPPIDHPGRYRSRLSNLDLSAVFHHSAFQWLRETADLQRHLLWSLIPG